MAKSTRKKSFTRKTNVVPDQLDLRDRSYMPSVALAPPAQMKPKLRLPVLDQEDTSACTGFALSNVVNFLLSSQQGARASLASPFMIYSMARRYDEFPGSSADTGSSLRGAMKGWYKHGVCRSDLWKTLDMPPPAKTAQTDWWLDAARRPLGAYYRVDTRSVTDMHVALNEVGILYASAICHDGWIDGFDVKSGKGGYWSIPQRPVTPTDGGHAFVIVGYNSHGFVLQNSWGVGWGTRGLALLSYEDWTENAMDCWVAQLGVVTEQHLDIAKSTSLRVHRGRVEISADAKLRNREIAPFIIDMANNGELSRNGNFRTQESDVEALVNFHIAEARKQWGLRADDPTDVAIYAHGGLTDEETAAETAAKWIPALYEAKVFPIFLMWETGLWATIKNRLEDQVKGLPKPTAGFVDQLKRWWNQRLERLLAPGGTMIWGEMKQNADSITSHDKGGGMILYNYARKSPWFGKTPVRLHLIGHSAGSIVHSHVVGRLAAAGWRFDSINFMAPAVRMDLFEQQVLPRIQDGTVKHFRTFHLNDTAEQKDPTVRPLLGYSRSLLYLVSESFENGVRTPLLGMEKYFDKHVGKFKLGNVHAWATPTSASASTTHGGFDDDATTMRSIVSLIKTNALPS